MVQYLSDFKRLWKLFISVFSVTTWRPKSRQMIFFPFFLYFKKEIVKNFFTYNITSVILLSENLTTVSGIRNDSPPRRTFKLLNRRCYKQPRMLLVSCLLLKNAKYKTTFPVSTSYHKIFPKNVLYNFFKFLLSTYFKIKTTCNLAMIFQMWVSAPTRIF